jgi:hypothetical protein
MVKKLMHVGWDSDEDRKKCVELMKGMARDGLFARHPRLLSVWEILIRHYEGGKEDQLKNIGDLIDSKDAPSNKNKSGSEAKREIASILDIYFTICSKGKEAEYVLSFEPESPRLKLDKRTVADSAKPVLVKSVDRAAEKDASLQEVIYAEKVHCKKRYRHWAYVMSLLASSPIVVFLLMFAIPGFSYYSMSLAQKHWFFWIVALVTGMLEVPIFFVWRSLLKLPESNFTHFIWSKFIKRDADDFGKNISLASYSGKCTEPECKGQVHLVNEFRKGLGYIGKCKAFPDYHWFTFDPVSLRGSRIKTRNDTIRPS